jgi:hypothetical protein
MKAEGLAPFGARPPYILKQPVLRKVASDAMINLATNRYSVPWQYIGQRLEVRKQDGRVCMYKDNQLIAHHPAAGHRHVVTAEPAHYQGLQTSTKCMKQDTVPMPEVQVRPLSVYAQLAVGGENVG